MTKKQSIPFLIFIVLFLIGAHLLAKSTYVSKFLARSEPNLKETTIIAGQFGELKIHKPDEPHSYSKSIELNGETIVEHDHVGFEQVYPKLSKPEIVIAWSDCGGSACGRPSATFIDLAAKPFFHKTIDELSPSNLIISKKSADEYILEGTSAYLTNEYGDLISLSLKYNRLNKDLQFTSKTSELYAKYIGKHPDNLLGDEQARAIFLRKMTSDDFKTFRHNISVSGAISSRNLGRYIIASGMSPHSGGDPAAFFIIDTIQDKFTAGFYSENSVKILSDDVENGILMVGGALLDELLLEHKMKWDFQLQKAVPIK